ncbi:hypothetical protein FNV43_RR09568 [Rhamnella rubrinervis]|uniref:Uncharacterized protein n=1 Tax=Rhamnella rubrinervis TaxID=2594499 RepID=A0A8K0MKC1_9ROSA|nr:hypothetical protein FNV43_RR09568 [Rhamnella rubrinervis]
MKKIIRRKQDEFPGEWKKTKEQVNGRLTHGKEQVNGKLTHDKFAGEFAVITHGEFAGEFAVLTHGEFAGEFAVLNHGQFAGAPADCRGNGNGEAKACGSDGRGGRGEGVCLFTWRAKKKLRRVCEDILGQFGSQTVLYLHKQWKMCSNVIL